MGVGSSSRTAVGDRERRPGPIERQHYSSYRCRASI